MLNVYSDHGNNTVHPHMKYDWVPIYCKVRNINVEVILATLTSGSDSLILRSVSPTFSSILPAVHALTGCDSTSALFGIGKKSVFKAIYDHPDDFSDLLTLNSEDDASALQAARKLTSALYDPKAKRTDAIQNLNNLRVKLASKKNASLIKLPPCEASFTQHVRRASWQTKIWMTSHIAMQDTGSP